MKKHTMTGVLSVLCLVPLVGLGAGCKDDKVGETVPPPPRELAEKSLKMGKAPIAGPQPGVNTPGR